MDGGNAARGIDRW